MQTPDPRTPASLDREDDAELAAASVLSAVLARLPAADRERAAVRRQQLRARLGALGLAALLFFACTGPQSSNLATRALALLIGAAATWRALVSILLGGVILVPAISAVCLLAVSVVLWQRLIAVQHRELQ